MSLLILLVLLWSALNYTLAYDYRNEDPSLSEPDGAIICDNLLPAFGFQPLRNNYWYRSYSTLQEICAQAQYGGHPLSELGPGRRLRYNIGANAGAYCDATAGQVVFEERRIYLGASMSLTHINEHRLRLLAYCKLRCRCANVPAADIKEIEFRRDRDELEAPAVNEVFALDLPDIPLPIPVVTTPMRSMELVSTVPNNLYAAVQQHSRWVGVDPENEIRCRGPLPYFRLPSPARKSDYTSLTELCAVGLIGGLPKANAGAFCHRTFAAPFAEPDGADVWFSDEMTPIVSWTWGADNPDPGNFDRHRLSTLMLREYCWQRCRCKDFRWRRRRDLSLQKIWPYLIGEIEKTDWIDSVERSGSSESSGSNSKGSSSNSLFSTGSSSLYSLNSLRGFLPESIEKLLDALPVTSKAKTCDSTCHGPEDCIAKSSSSCPYQPQCRVDPKSLTETVMGSLATASLAYTAFACLPRLSPSSRLGGRDVSSADEEQAAAMSDWPCACNVTHVSHGCCDSHTGQVWEPSGDSLGILAF